MALFISNKDVAQLLGMSECVGVLEEAFTHWGDGSGTNHPRTRIRLPGGFLHYMAAAAPEMGLLGLRAYTTFGGRGQSMFMLFDSESGELLSLMESALMSTIRTGAASGLATKYMAREDASTVGIIGCGSQAAAQLEAVCTVRAIRHVRVFSRTGEKREAFASNMRASLGIDVAPVESGEECVRDMDVIITITGSREPVLNGEWLADGAHVNAAGSNHWIRREIDDRGLKRFHTIVVDDLEQARKECGELIWACERGTLCWDRVHELRAVVSGRLKGRLGDSSITLFESQGLAIEDLAAAKLVYTKALDQCKGQEMPF